MELHKPRAIHSWRELLGEIGVIVIGVVIALSAEGALQRFELHAKVRHTEELMREEIALDDGPQVLQRIALAPCIEESLDRIRAAVEQGADRPAVIQAIRSFDPPRHSWDSIIFAEATASGIVSHLPADRIWRWAYLYSKMPSLDRANEREFLDVARLRSLSAVGGPLTPGERGQLLEAVEALRRDNADIVSHVMPSAAAIRDLGIRIDTSGKSPNEFFAPAGPARVIEQLQHLPMAAACVPALQRAMGDSR
ncbi:MAG: hypothetical protein JSR36_15125 [Proteobacteria bacterium]|nr:hypothetical protein [Pseudomonadota bacterium]